MLYRKRSIGSLKSISKSYFMDQYAYKARQQKLRSRSWFKIQEIDRLDSLFKRGMTVIDLGSTPGGWSSYAIRKVGNTGKVIACDVLPMKKILGVNFILGDCTKFNILNMLYRSMRCKKVQIVLSDMSPCTTGISIIDVSKSIYLGNVALNICKSTLLPKGKFLVKVFQGKGFEKYLYDVQSLFKLVKIRKPNSSRSNSREVYIVAKELKDIHD